MPENPAPAVFVPAGTPRPVRFGALFAGTPGFFVIFGSIFAGVGGFMTLIFAAAMEGKEKLAALFPALFLAIGLAFLIPGLKKIALRRELYRNGTFALGKVTSVEETNTTLNEQTVLDIHYVFAGPYGEVQGKTSHVKAPPVGADVSVLYDPTDPSRSVLPLPGTFPKPGGAA
ncbi:hypothetical protein FBQ97_13310 [Acidobacteria bacterium ACD]|nr:MAG: hypothetical protein EDX89_21220 [Acidobacteriota bacterium]MCE7960134.1 hypothetical protein [Acidobacteria bacterium ACB2]MDL1950776.1 hypothetical protein [Acidobacteria bacterium ACD]